MRARLAGTVMLSTVVFFVVAVLVSVGVLWWSGDVAVGIVTGGNTMLLLYSPDCVGCAP
jgi:hypothetical protein